MFIFSTFTGLAYTDLKKLRVNDIPQSEDGSWWIHIHRQKTGTLSSVRLLDIPLKIIEKYREQRKDDKVFNLYSRTYFIMLAHQLGEVYGFELTFHKARHNFGTHITLSLPEWIGFLVCMKKMLLSRNEEGDSDTNCPTTKKRPCKEAVSFTFASYPSLFFPASFISVIKNFLYV